MINLNLLPPQPVGAGRNPFSWRKLLPVLWVFGGGVGLLILSFLVFLVVRVYHSSYGQEIFGYVPYVIGFVIVGLLIATFFGNLKGHNILTFLKIFAIAVLVGCFAWFLANTLIGHPVWTLGISSGMFFFTLWNMTFSGITVIPPSQYKGLLFKNNSVVPGKDFRGGWYLTIPLFALLEIKPVYTGQRTEEITVKDCYAANGYPLVVEKLSVTFSVTDTAEYFKYLLDGTEQEFLQGFKNYLEICTRAIIFDKVPDGEHVRDFRVSNNDWFIQIDPDTNDYVQDANGNYIGVPPSAYAPAATYAFDHGISIENMVAVVMETPETRKERILAENRIQKAKGISASIDELVNRQGIDRDQAMWIAAPEAAAIILGQARRQGQP